MGIDVLMLNFTQALGGITRRDEDVWLVEIPIDGERTRVLFFRLNSVLMGDDTRENVLVCSTSLGEYRGEHALARLESVLRFAIELRYARVALRDDELVLFALAPEVSTEDLMLEMVHEVAWMGEQISQELERVC